MSVRIYGKNPAIEILSTDKKVFNAFVMEDTNQDIIKILKEKNININYLNKHNFKKDFLGNHQGIVLEVEDYKTLDLDEFIASIDIKTNPLVLMLDGITDPHNFGAIIRSAEAGGVAGVIIPNKRSVKITGTVAKVSSGAIEYVKIVEVTNLRNSIDKLKKIGFWAIGTDLNADKSYQDIDITVPLLLVMGSEGKGVSKIIKDNVDYNVKIDMAGKINSLNASVSAGILIFDILRKKS
ncbi:MAG: 23S rRNA (guanosine(2251)-2'-O)-methyltransferase RlmB [Tenericutes bacterium]|nr:23S rRNA (guanosine(2251)-2'-O)-methyltransferase RlmB [Mycoplasmatota bacterium]